MASDKFEVGDILVCVDDSPWANIPSYPHLVRAKAYEVSEVRRSGDVCLVGGDTRSWKGERFRRALLSEIRKYRKEQGYENHHFAIGELVVCIACDCGLLPPIGQTCVVSATKSDDERECFVDIDGGGVPGRFFAAYFRKATPAEAAAYRKVRNEAPIDSIESVSRGDTIVFAGSNGNGRKYGAVAVVWTVIFGQGGKVSSLEIRNPVNTNIEQWSHTSPEGWVPVGKGYELVALGQPIHTGDEWLEAGRWNRTIFRTGEGYTKETNGILRRKVKEDAVTVQIGNLPPFKAAVLDPTFNLTFTWGGSEKMPLSGNDSPESINKAISVPNPQTLTSADGREFDIIDWNPKVKTGEVVTVEANLLVKLAKGPKPEPKPEATPFKKGDIVVCTDSTNQHDVATNRIARGRTYRIEGIDSCGYSRVNGILTHWAPSRFRLATVAEITAYWEKLGFPNHQFKADDIVVCVDARPYSPSDTDLSQLEEGNAYKVEAVRDSDIKPSGCLHWNRVRFRLATPAEAQAFLAERAAKEATERAAKEATEKQPPKDPGIGYRFLDKEELVVEGDEYWSPTGKEWSASTQWQLEGAQFYDMTYRRRNQFAEGELVQIIKPATQALRDEYPGWVAGSVHMDGLDGKVLECPPSRALGWGNRGIDIFLDLGRRWTVDVDWLAPASSKQKAAFQAEKNKKAKVQELEDKMKAIESELAILKGT